MSVGIAWFATLMTALSFTGTGTRSIFRSFAICWLQPRSAETRPSGKGRTLLAFQFHPEVMLAGFEHWLIGHACELSSQPDVSRRRMRTDTAKFAAALQRRARAMIEEWLRELKS